MNWIARVALVVIAVGGIIGLLDGNRAEDLRGKLVPGNEVIMYSLTTCGYCTKTRAMLDESGIPYTEHFLDTDKAREREFFERLVARGVPQGGVGTPSLVVNDVLLLNNPPFEAIKRHLKLLGGVKQP